MPAPRLLVATSKSLKSARDAGLFREDLYGRIAPIKIEIPPLRERREDVLALADHFLKAELTTGRHYTLTPDAQAALEMYAWPGNVRELENAIRHAITFAKGVVIAAADLQPKIQDAGSSSMDSNCFIVCHAFWAVMCWPLARRRGLVPAGDRRRQRLHGHLIELIRPEGQARRASVESGARKIPSLCTKTDGSPLYCQSEVMG